MTEKPNLVPNMDFPQMVPEDIDARATREKVLAKLRKDVSPNSIVTVMQATAQEKLLEELKKEMDEATLNLWFPGTEVKVNLEKITADVRDTDFWSELFGRFKDGEIDKKELIDYVILSHLTVTDEPDPMRVHERQVRQGLQSRVGVRYLSQMTDAANRALKSAVDSIVAALPEGVTVNPDIKLLAPIQVDAEDSENTVIKQDPELRALSKMALGEDLLDQDFKEQILQEMFAGEMIYDRLFEMTFNEMVDQLSASDDSDFDSQRYAIVDAGMENQHKAVKRLEYGDDPTGKRFVVYTVVLSNIFNGFGGTHSDDRGVSKYLLKEDITHEQFDYLMSLIQQRYYNFIAGRKEHSEHVMGWRSREEILKDMHSPTYNVAVPFAVQFVRDLTDAMTAGISAEQLKEVVYGALVGQGHIIEPEPAIDELEE